MPAPEIDLHGPHWVNTVGHLAGLVIFANLFWLLYRDAARVRQPLRVLPLLSTLLALGWDLGLFAGLALRDYSPFWANASAAAAFACLSILPAVLLDLGLAGRYPVIRAVGYTASGFCALLHLSEVFLEGPDVHGFSLLLLAASFCLLTLVSYWRSRRSGEAMHTATAVCLFLFSLSFLHFRDAAGSHSVWSEILLHHAAIPIALFFVLQDYRFLLADAFLRLSASATLAIGFVSLLWVFREPIRFWAANEDPFARGILFSGIAALLFVFAWLRQSIQSWITRRVFLRRNPDELAQQILGFEGDERNVLDSAAALLAEYFRAPNWRLQAEASPDAGACLRLQFLKGDSVYLVFRGRRFLSEDFLSLNQFGALISQAVDRARNRELERLVSQAELKALQAQIHPHFLFNALNALYGSIPRAAAEARRLAMSLSELFRYFLTTSKSMVRLEEELQIIEAYLRIEQARLGARLTIRIEVAPEVLDLPIPVLSLQPLVENAIQHGIAAQAGPGTLTLRAFQQDSLLVLEVHDTGPGPQISEFGSSNRIGLENVRRRLALHYGALSQLRLSHGPDGTLARMEIPAQPAVASAQPIAAAADSNSI